MRSLQDMSLLLLSGFLFLFDREPEYTFIMAFLFGVILCCLGYFTESRRLHCALCLLFLGSAVFLPAFCCFSPAAVYILLREHSRPALIFGLIFYGVSLCRYSDRPFFFSAWSLLMLLTAFFLERRTEAADLLEQNIRKLRDDSTENSLLLTEKNRALMEKQDYEIYAATLRERNRIAREIHDNVGHLLSRSILMVGAAKTVNQSEAVAPILENLNRSLDQAMTSIRTSVHDLHDESVNLKESAESLVKDFSFCPVSLTYDMGLDIPREVKYCILSILKEGLSNIARHSGASLASVTIREHPAFYQFSIEDNGNGGCAFSGGIGLSNMRDRLASLHGTLQIRSEKGFHLFITIPKEQELSL